MGPLGWLFVILVLVIFLVMRSGSSGGSSEGEQSGAHVRPKGSFLGSLFFYLARLDKANSRVYVKDAGSVGDSALKVLLKGVLLFALVVGVGGAYWYINYHLPVVIQQAEQQQFVLGDSGQQVDNSTAAAEKSSWTEPVEVAGHTVRDLSKGSEKNLKWAIRPDEVSEKVIVSVRKKRDGWHLVAAEVMSRWEIKYDCPGQTILKEQDLRLTYGGEPVLVSSWLDACRQLESLLVLERGLSTAVGGCNLAQSESEAGDRARQSGIETLRKLARELDQKRPLSE